MNMDITATVGDTVVSWRYDPTDGYWYRFIDDVATGQHRRGLESVFEQIARDVDDYLFNLRTH